MIPNNPTSAARATLPRSIDDEHAGRLVGIDGTGEWPPRLASALVSTRSVAVVSLGPGSCPTIDTADLDGVEGRIILDAPWSNSPAIGPAREALQEIGGCRLDVQIHAPAEEPMTARLVGSLLFIDALSPIVDLRLDASDPLALLARGDSADGHSIGLTITRSLGYRPQLRLRAVSETERLEVVLPDEQLALPARTLLDRGATRVDQQLPWETPSRTAWRRARMLLDSDRPAAGDVGRLRSLQDLIHRWDSPSPARP